MSLVTILPIVTKGLSKTFARTALFLVFFSSIKSKISNIRVHLLAEENKKQAEIISDLTRRLALKDRIISIISHDTRSPLHTLRSLLDLLNDNHVTQEEFREIAASLNQQVGQLSLFLENLLNWIKNINAEIKPRFAQLPLHGIVEESIGLFALQAKRKLINIESRVSSNAIVYADEEMVKLVLRNLVNNAIKFCNEGDSIFIETKEFLGGVRISVEDTGQGISQESISTLFEVSHLNSVGTKDEIGTGLGLNLCREFVEKMGGKITATSAEGEGSKFEFTINAPSTPSYEFQKFIDGHE